MVREGGCTCGRLRYRVAGPLGPVVSCHCGFCRRTHGAAFTTVALVPGSAVAWLPGSGEPSRYETPLGNVRHFCGSCATPLWNFSPELDLAAIVTASLVGDPPEPWAHVNTESQAPWLKLADDLPRFAAWPTAEELRELLRRHPGAFRPEPLLGSAG